MRASALPLSLTTLAAAVAVMAVPGTAQAAPSIGVGASILAPNLGPGLVDRTFVTRLDHLPRGRVLSVTFTAFDEPAVRAAVRSLPDGSTIDYWHEPEDDVERGTLSPEVWAARTVRLAQIVREEQRIGQVQPSAVFMRWSIDPHSHREAVMGRLATPAVLGALRDSGGFIGWDVYAGARSHRTPDEMYGVGAQWAAERGLRWGVTETGYQTTDANAAAAAEHWRASFAYVAGGQVPSPPVVFLAWNPPDRNAGVFALQRWESSAAVWRDAAQRY